MTVTNKPTWNDGTLRSLQLVTNGFPKETDEPALPDELFLSNLEGERLVEVTRTIGADGWTVRENTQVELLFEDFQSAFEKGLQLARNEVENQ